MFRHTVRLGRIFGIPIGLDHSWFLVFVLLTWSFAVGYYPSEFPAWSESLYWMMGALTAIMLFVSVLLHELGHSIMARRYKIRVQNITLFIFGGIAQMTSEPPKAAAEFWIAVAGPAVSLVLAALFGFLQTVFTAVSPLLALTKYLAFINGMLVLFNLIPGFPLDGGRVFRAVVWGITHNFYRATIIAASVGRFIAFLFIFFGVWQLFTGNITNGIWIAFIGWFLETAASGQMNQQILQSMVAGHTVSEAMGTNYTFVPGNYTLQHLVDDHILGSGRRYFVVGNDTTVEGLLTLHQIRAVPREKWRLITAAETMIPKDKMKRIRPNLELWAALVEMDRDGVNQLPVMANGHIEGMLSREDVISYLKTVQELGLYPAGQKKKEI